MNTTDLHKLQPGDLFSLEEDHQYMVTDVFFVSSNDVRMAYPEGSERQAYLTCDTTSYSDGEYAGRIAVLAERTD
jgi:sortase (surface protein transpeptidase)